MNFYRSAIWALFMLTLSVDATAAEESEASDELQELVFDDLMKLPVTSVSKKEQRLGDAAAAIAVITQEDIRRSGLTSIPELLRLVPGLHVARIHGNEWAVTARGFNDQYANKLLVLIDGRSIYTPMFAGVYWSAQQVMLEDLDRIEVIRGPGAALWGANAVNGVINIVTKDARETQGALATGSFGTEERPSAGFRYGGEIFPDLHYRAYARYFSRDGLVEGTDGKSPDDWDMASVGARLEWQPTTNDRITLQGDYYRGTVGEYFEGVALTQPFLRPQNLRHGNFGGNALGRWSRQLTPASELTVQTYYDRFHHGDGDITETRDTLDLEARHRFPLGSRHEILWGAGYRYTADRLSPTFYLSFDPQRAYENFYNVFLQDEIAITPERLKLIVGTKVEHHPTTGVEVQPNVRALWTPTSGHTIWAAASRAVRTPSRYDRDSRLNTAVSQSPPGPPFLVALLGDPDVKAEELLAYESGYRIELSKPLSIDLATFYNVYDRLYDYAGGPVIFENTPAPAHLLLPLTRSNGLSGETYGSELSMQWLPGNRWKLIAAYTWLHMRMLNDDSKEEENPQHQFHVRSYFDLPNNLQLSGAANYVSRITVPLDNDTASLESHIRLDLGLNWRATDTLEIGIWGQNLLERRHAEYGSFKTRTLTQIPRSVLGKITWNF